LGDSFIKTIARDLFYFGRSGIGKRGCPQHYRILLENDRYSLLLL
jgi:hypothetical protein